MQQCFINMIPNAVIVLSKWQKSTTNIIGCRVLDEFVYQHIKKKKNHKDKFFIM